MVERSGRTEQFMMERARPLERVQWQYAAGQTNVDQIWFELAAFRNKDGGFGNGLEPDFWLGESSPMAVSRALQLLYRYRAPADHPLIQDALRYLQERFDPQIPGWRAVSAAVNAAPHAPWWHHDPKADNHWDNPNAELAAYFHLWPPPQAVSWSSSLLTYGDEYLLQLQPEEAEFHGLICFVRNLEARDVPADDRRWEHLRLLIEAHLPRSAHQWREYGPQPLNFCTSPASCLYPHWQKEVWENIEFWLDTLGSDGVWYPNWEWGQYPVQWQEARLWWAGILTLERWQILQAFGADFAGPGREEGSSA